MFNMVMPFWFQVVFPTQDGFVPSSSMKGPAQRGRVAVGSQICLGHSLTSSSRTFHCCFIFIFPLWVLAPVGFSAFCGFFSDNKGVMDFTVDDPANTSQEPGDALHGPSFADGGLQLETPNLFGDFTNDSLYVTLMIGSPLSPRFSGDDEPVSNSARAVPGESVVSDSAALDGPLFQPVIRQDVHDSLFARNLLTNCDVTGIVLPWETGIFRELLSDDPVQLVPKMPISNMCQLVNWR